MTDYSKLLNAEQLAAATAGDGPLLVLAAAGTGKTRTLVYRVAYLIEKGVSPDNLLLLTFTNRAASEMLERAQQVAGPDVGRLWSGTFHHICNRFLRRFADRIGYPNNFAILDREDTHTLINSCIRENVRDKKEFPKKDVVASWIGRAKNSACTIEDLVSTDGFMNGLTCDPGDIIKVVTSYEAKKAKNGMMDFDDLLVNGLKLLREHEDIRQFYQQKFLHVLVDEYQDTNLLQAQMVDILAGLHKNIMAVGDDFQCIYSWRGADFRNIMEFPKRWPGCKILKLEQNYRSTPEVLDVANACIRGNPEQFQKTLRATRPMSSKPSVLLLRDGDEQARAVISMIQDYRERGYKLSDMAVLYRAHFHSIELQMALGRARIPNVITSGVGVFEQAHIKDILSFFRVCEQPTDFLSFSRLLGMVDGMGEKGISAAWAKIGGRFVARDPAARKALVAAIRPSARKQWEKVDSLLAAYFDEHLATKGTEAIERFFTGFYKSYLTLNYEDPDKRAEDIDELSQQVSKTESIPTFLQEVALLTNVDQEYTRESLEGPADQIRLSTVHQAKGLEWKIVFVIWAVEGMFPSSRSIEDNENDAEERRLFYVAVTRARDELVLCAPSMRRMRDGGTLYCKPSRFIKEIPHDLIRERYGLLQP